MKKNILIATAFLVAFTMNAQVGIDTDNPQVSLHVAGANETTATSTPGVLSAADGVLVPRVTTDMRDSETPANGTIVGQLVFSTDADSTGFWYWTGVTSGSGTGAFWDPVGGSTSTSPSVRIESSSTTVTNDDLNGYIILSTSGQAVNFPTVSGTFSPSTGDTVTVTSYVGTVSNTFVDNRFGNANPFSSTGAVTFVYANTGVPATTGWYNVNGF